MRLVLAIFSTVFIQSIVHAFEIPEWLKSVESQVKNLQNDLLDQRMDLCLATMNIYFVRVAEPFAVCDKKHSHHPDLKTNCRFKAITENIMDTHYLKTTLASCIVNPLRVKRQEILGPRRPCRMCRMQILSEIMMFRKRKQLNNQPEPKRLH